MKQAINEHQAINNINVYYEFDTNGTIPFVQVQTRAVTLGAIEGTVDIHIVKSY